MARRAYFSFHYKRDIWRAQQVKNSWLTKPDREAAGFFNASLEEAAKSTDEGRLKKLIRDALIGTTCTVVLIGRETADRKYVQYEIEHSMEQRKALLGIKIHRLKNSDGRTDYWSPGTNPFQQFKVGTGLFAPRLSHKVRVYDWRRHDGYANLGRWIDEAIETKPW